ncbi:MAG: NUDIX domain-containing protein [Patescibacteria group bacterium]|jgi:8-oxo-dGTP diphosphatase|nr:NUDIX domain-containing protein [Patescibacteria group bacterium]
MTQDKQVKVGVGAVIINGNKTLLAKRKGSHASGYYGSVGGHLEYGEDLTIAVKREAMEELGVEIGNIKFVSCANIIKHGKHYLDVSFVAEIISGEPKICEPDKIESIGWYSLDDLPEPLFEPVKIVLEAIKKKKTYFEIRE